MKRTFRKILCTLLVVVMCLTSAPLSGFVGLDFTVEATNYKIGDIIQFGSYPQSKVTDSATITVLNNKAPAWNNWTSYGYYSGTGDYGTMKPGDWMRYTDITYNGNKYRGVKFTQYRPFFTFKSSSSDTYQDDNGYRTNTVYWFKFEPIDWRILDPATGLVMCETIIDSQPYSNTIYKKGSGGTYGYFNDASYTNYASDYETSSVREWLNNDFYNTAFTDSEKEEINTTTLNNDGYYTSVGTTGYENLDSNSTNDKIFLLSYNEVLNSDFGFNSSSSAPDPARFAQGSDYAKCQGLYVQIKPDHYSNNNSYWVLRSSGSSSDYCCGVKSTGRSNFDYHVYRSLKGIRPAFYLDVDAWKTGYYLNGTLSGSSNMPKIAIDGVWYEYDTSIPNLAETIDRFAIGSNICCKIISGKIVACSKYGISNRAMATISTGNVNSIKYSAVTKEYDMKKIELGIGVTNRIVSNTYGIIDTGYLAGYDITFDKIVLESSEKDLLCFKNGVFKSDDTEINLDPVVLKAGNVHWLGEKTQMIVNDDYNWSNNETKKEVIITALMYNGTELVASDTEKITFINQSAVDNLKKTQETEQESQTAANLLNNTSSVIFNAFLSEIFTSDELKTIQNALECKTALCALPKSVYEKAGIEEKIMNKLMGRLGVDKDWFGSTYTADISLKVLVDTQKYGQLEITFKAPVTFISFGSDNPFAGVNFDISYEITGGKGKSKVDKQFHKGSPIGALTYANVNNFAVSVQKIALAQLESAYNLGYGDDLNKVGEMLMGETFTKILSKTSAKSYSHLTFTMITFPSKQISIHCPVDVYMYDENGKLCVSIVDNEIQQECDDVDVLVLGDEKFISVYDGKYSLKVVATAIDTMDITIEEYSTENEKIRTTTFNDIALQPGDSFNAEITETYIEDTCELKKNEIETIKSDKDDILIHCAVPVEKIEKEATCSAEGSKHIECTVCEEVLKTEAIAKLPHKYSSVVTEATCETGGYTTYTCTCGYSYTGDKTSAKGHDYAEGVCKNCGDSKIDNCSCNCHKSGFMGFIWKIILFFQKIFKTNKTCGCGVAHY